MATPFKQEMPNPSPADLEHNLFDALYQAIKTWDVEVPEFHDGYCAANGSHVKLILNGLDEATKDSNLVRECRERMDEMGCDLEVDFAAQNLLRVMQVFALGGHGGESAAWVISTFNHVVDRHGGDVADEESAEREVSRLEDDMLAIRDALGDDVPINAEGIIAAINDRRTALALARSMLLSGESMSPEAEATFARAGIPRG